MNLDWVVMKCIHFIKEENKLQYNYFEMLKSYLEKRYELSCCNQEMYNIKIDNILGIGVNENVKYIYEHYKKFNLVWFDEGKYLGEVDFVPYIDLEKEHAEIVGIMEDIYNIELDDLKVYQSIINWYPLFKFATGDAFCFDKRDGSIRFYDHEIYDYSESKIYNYWEDVGVFGIKIANSINELYEKWGKIHFADVYDWYEICNENGIDVSSDLALRYF